MTAIQATPPDVLFCQLYELLAGSSRLKKKRMKKKKNTCKADSMLFLAALATFN